MDFLRWLFDAQLTIGGGFILWREVIGNLFGLASALGGMRRKVWAWPVGIIGNVLLFTVFVTGEMSGATDEPLWGQAGRQVFFAAVGVYGWWRWRQVKREQHTGDAHAITPRWASWGERAGLVVTMVLGVAVLAWRREVA